MQATNHPNGKKVLVCCGTGCLASGSMEVFEAFREGLRADSGVQVQAYAKSTGCNGWCEQGPLVKILPDDITYCHVDRRPGPGDH